ncbi:UDP-glycosyltransferase 74E1 [Linum grandiflorum]
MTLSLEQQALATEAPHVVVIPWPAMGHINPSTQFSKNLVAKGLSVTMLIFSEKKLFHKDAAGPVAVVQISDEGILSDPIGEDYYETYRILVCRELRKFIAGMVTGSRPCCVVYDSLFPWILATVKELGMMGAPFFTQPMAVNAVYLNVMDGRAAAEGFPAEMEAAGDLPSFVTDLDAYPGTLEIMTGQFRNIRETDWAFCNTFYSLEEKTDSQASINQWLDTKPTGSVIYASLGSISDISKSQITEMAQALRLSNHPFIWVVRESEQVKLPPGFVSDTTCLVVDWCRQLEVLAHPSVGCFVTHCGWNSTIEAISLGVPMVTLPIWVDQPTNAKFVGDVWHVGARAKGDVANGVVVNEEIGRRIKEVMEGESGEEIRRNVDKWKRLAQKHWKLLNVFSHPALSTNNSMSSVFITAGDITDDYVKWSLIINMASCNRSSDKLSATETNVFVTTRFVNLVTGRPHVVVIPWPEQGHVNPAVQFSKLLVAKGLAVTLLTFSDRELFRGPGLEQSPGLTVEEISDEGILEKFEGNFHERYECLVIRELLKFVSHATVRPCCVVYDSLMSWVLATVKEAGIMAAPFFTQPAAVNAVYLNVLEGREATEGFPADLAAVMEVGDLPSFVSDEVSYPGTLAFVTRQLSNVREADWVFCNTVYSLEEEDKLPTGFTSSTTGMVVDWCHQLELLAHPSVGCFVTHSGWNSTMEAISLGVPMVALPVWTDQPTNAKFVEDVWCVGARAKAETIGGVVKREEIQRQIEKVMEGKNGEQIKRNAEMWQRLVLKAVAKGGSSDKNIDEFVTAARNRH